MDLNLEWDTCLRAESIASWIMHLCSKTKVVFIFSCTCQSRKITAAFLTIKTLTVHEIMRMMPKPKQIKCSGVLHEAFVKGSETPIGLHQYYYWYILHVIDDNVLNSSRTLLFQTLHMIHKLKVTNETHFLDNIIKFILQAAIQVTQGKTFFNTPKYSIWNLKPLWLPTPHAIANRISPIYITNVSTKLYLPLLWFICLQNKIIFQDIFWIVKVKIIIKGCNNIWVKI